MAENDNLSMVPATVASESAVMMGGAIPAGGLSREFVDQMKVKAELMKEFNDLRDKFIEESLVEGPDYGIVPGCGKRKMLKKPGAERIGRWFGYVGDPVLIDKVEDRENGYFEYRYRCDVYMVGTNIKVGSAERQCNSKESRWGSAKPFDIKDNVMAKAQKRAYVGAMKVATATSGIFEEEDDGDGDGSGSGGTNQATQDAAASGDYRHLIRASMKSQYGDEGRPTKCTFCGEFHVLKGEPIVAIDGPDNKRVYGSEKCLARKWAQEHPAPKAEVVDEKTGEVKSDSGQPPGSAPVEGATLNVSQIKALNAAIHESGKPLKSFLSFLANFDGMYSGKSLNDILQSDFERVMSAWNQAVKVGAV